MGLGWFLAWVLTPVYLSVLVLLLYPQKYLTGAVLTFLQAHVKVAERKVKVVHIILVITGLYFNSKFWKNWEGEEGPFEYLNASDKMTRAKEERDLYLSGVSFFCVLYTMQLADLVENYLQIKR